MPEVAATVPATPDRFSEIDVSDWLIAGDETLGTKPKKWLRHPDTGERWLMKYVTGNRNADGSEYPKGDDWSERVANGVALRLEIPAARTELAFEHLSETRFGVISGSVLAPHDNGGRATEELVPGNELLPQPVIGGDRLAYTVDAVQQALDDVEPPSEATQGFTAWEVFVGYLLLDAVIGNTDRHEEN